MIIFSRAKDAKVKMKNTLLVFCTLFGTLQAVKGFPLLWDTSDYKVLQEPRGKDYDFFADKCRGKQGSKICYGQFQSIQGPLWHYRVQMTLLTLQSAPWVIADISGYSYRSLLTLQGTSTDPYWHYRVHSQILTDITGDIHRSLLTLQGTSTDPYWHYRVHPQVHTDITGDIHRSLLTLQGTSTDPYWHYRVHP